MTADALRKITTAALDTLAALLDEGYSDGLTALLRTMARFHRYSFHNLCLITAQCRPQRASPAFRPGARWVASCAGERRASRSSPQSSVTVTGTRPTMTRKRFSVSARRPSLILPQPTANPCPRPL